MGLILLSSLILGIISFSRPTSRIVKDDIQVQHLGIFSYLAPAPRGIYDSNTIQSGDPIFPALTCSVDVNLQYTLITPGAQNITGTHQLIAVIHEQTSGWQRSVPLQEKTSFNGNSFGTTAKLDVCKMASLTQSMEQETGFHPGSYTLSIIPNVTLTGELTGHKLEGTFNSSLHLLYDRVHFYLIRNEDTENPLSITAVETLPGERNEVNTVAFLNREVDVPLLRWLAASGLVVSLAGLAILGIKLQQLSVANQAEYFRVRHDSLIVDVQPVDELGGKWIDVLSLDALAKLAERFNVMILHVEHGNVHEYFVQAGGTTYRFVLDDGMPESSIPTNEANPGAAS